MQACHALTNNSNMTILDMSFSCAKTFIHIARALVSSNGLERVLKSLELESETS